MISELARERYAAFVHYMEQFGGRGRWLVLTHDNPDPDSLASAAILRKILQRRFGRPATIAYGGIVGRAENREMVRTLKLQLSRVRHVSFRNYRHFALVDAQPRTGNHQLPEDIVPDLVIDHHPLRKATLESPLHDLRQDYGATASIVAEYLLLSGLPVSRRDATAIVYAVRTETLEFSRETPGPDRTLYDHFFTLADKRVLGKILRPRLPVSYFRTLQEAMGNLEIVDSLVVCSLGDVEQPDIVPEIADLLLRLEGATWSLCSGFHEERIYCSIRTSNPRADAARLMQRILGNRGKGGGHAMVAGGWLGVPAGTSAEERRGLQRGLARRLAELLDKNPDRLIPIDLGGA